MYLRIENLETKELQIYNDPKNIHFTTEKMWYENGEFEKDSPFYIQLSEDNSKSYLASFNLEKKHPGINQIIGRDF